MLLSLAQQSNELHERLEDLMKSWESSLEKMRPRASYDRVRELREKCATTFLRRYSADFVPCDCPVCDTPGEYSFSKLGYEHRKCPRCLTLFCSPRTSEEHLERYYADYEAPKAWTNLLLQTDLERKIVQYFPRADIILDVLESRESGCEIPVDKQAFFSHAHHCPEEVTK